ncbi:MAG: hypothetical protein HY917_00410 [Candidatus Diapherotrites archaeon]|nr:hypothetical protein [Candidatus Diapherotrites archaeon]
MNKLLLMAPVALLLILSGCTQGSTGQAGQVVQTQQTVTQLMELPVYTIHVGESVSIAGETYQLRLKTINEQGAVFVTMNGNSTMEVFTARKGETFTGHGFSKTYLVRFISSIGAPNAHVTIIRV